MVSTLIVVSLVSFVAGIVVAAVWPRKTVTADYVTLRSETKRLETLFTTSVNQLHTKVDDLLSRAKSKVSPGLSG
jgi:hypothetical protein